MKNDALYHLEYHLIDALDRLEPIVQEKEAAQANEPEWDTLTDQEKVDRLSDPAPLATLKRIMQELKDARALLTAIQRAAME